MKEGRCLRKLIQRQGIKTKVAQAPLVEAASIPHSESSCQMSDLEGNANLCFEHSINDDELNLGPDSWRRNYITNMPELASKRNQLEPARQGCPIQTKVGRASDVMEHFH